MTSFYTREAASAAGSNGLFALKTARAELNGSAHHGLRIVATGSNRDKLARRFFYAPLVSFPPLGEDYLAWFLEHLDFRAELQAPAVYAWFHLMHDDDDGLGCGVQPSPPRTQATSDVDNC